MYFKTPKYLTEKHLLSKAGYELFETLNNLRIFNKEEGEKTSESYASDITYFMAREGLIESCQASEISQLLYAGSVVSDLYELDETTEPDIEAIDEALAEIKIKIIEQMKNCIEEYTPSKEEEDSESD